MEISTNQQALHKYALLGLLLLFTACSNDDEVEPEIVRQATVTYLVSPNGLGDNGYNDAAAEGIFAFAGETGTRLRLLMPKDEAEAERMYRQWLTENAAQDSAVLILGSSAYETMAQRLSPLTIPEQSSPTRSLSHFSPQSGSRVLLFESDAEIEGISSVIISRYGVSWLAGAMSQNFDALILAAAPGITLLEESIAGFMKARESYAGDYAGIACKTYLHYLTEGESGFAMPDSAYRYIARRADKYFNYDELIFPLLGGSEAGILRYLNDNEFTTALMVGMDVDQTGFSTRIPFSVVIRIGDVVQQYLNDWLAGREWPTHQRLGMKDKAADIVITPNFAYNLVISDMRYDNPATFLRLYNEYKAEAIRKEDTYESDE